MSGLTDEDIYKAVEALKNAEVNPYPQLLAPNEWVAEEWAKQYPGVKIWLNGEVYVPAL